MLPIKRKANKMPQRRRGRLRRGLRRADHLARRMQVAPGSTRRFRGTALCARAEGSKGKGMGRILSFSVSSPQAQQSAELGQLPTTIGGNLISF